MSSDGTSGMVFKHSEHCNRITNLSSTIAPPLLSLNIGPKAFVAPCGSLTCPGRLILFDQLCTFLLFVYGKFCSMHQDLCKRLEFQQ